MSAKEIRLVLKWTEWLWQLQANSRQLRSRTLAHNHLFFREKRDKVGQVNRSLRNHCGGLRGRASQALDCWERRRLRSPDALQVEWNLRKKRSPKALNLVLWIRVVKERSLRNLRESLMLALSRWSPCKVRDQHKLHLVWRTKSKEAQSPEQVSTRSSIYLYYQWKRHCALSLLLNFCLSGGTLLVDISNWFFD